MQIILNILIVFIIINTILKLSFWKLGQVLVMVLLLIGFVFFVFPFAMEQSQTTMKQKLENPDILGNMAVLVTLECTLFLFYSFFSIQDFFRKKRSRWKIFLKYYPGLLIFPVVFYLLTQVFFTFTGTDFIQSTVVFSIAIGACVIGGSYLIRFLIPEEELRLEIQFLVSLFVTVLGLIATSSGKMVYVATSEPLDFRMLALTAGLFISLFLIGFFFNRIWWKIFSKN